MRHEKVRREVISNAFQRHSLLGAGFLNSAHECLALVINPVTNLVRQRKSLAPVRAVLTNRDDGGVITPDDRRLAPVKFAKANRGAQMKCYGLKIDLSWLCDSQFLKQTLGWSEMRHV